MAMKKWLLAVLLSFVVIGLIGCGTASEQPIAAVPSRDPLEIYVGAHSNQATAQAAQATAEYFQQMITATAAAQQATATERAWLVQQTQVAVQMTATAQVWGVTATADSVKATATAAAEQTAQAVILAITANAATTTAEVNAANAKAYAVAMEGEEARIRNAMERDRMTNTFRAVLPWAGMVAAFILLLYLLYYHGRMRIVPKDERGDAPLLVDVVDGVVADADRQFHPMGGMRRGDWEALNAPTPQLQAGVTERDQMVDLATRPGAEPGAWRNAAVRQIGAPPSAPQLPRVTIVAPQAVQPRLGDVIPPMMLEAAEGEIEEEKDER